MRTVAPGTVLIMTQNGLLQILLFFCAVLFTVKPMGIYMARVFQREHTVLDPLLSPVESLIYKATRVDPGSEMRWTEYSFAMLLFSAASLLLTYFIESAQSLLPLNPQKLAAVAPDLAFTTAASFTTNTTGRPTLLKPP
jgi:K+-transporting ATPase ATPase A chain